MLVRLNYTIFPKTFQIISFIQNFLISVSIKKKNSFRNIQTLHLLDKKFRYL
jgi:hypothetical protein